MMNVKSEVFLFTITPKTRIMAANFSRKHSQADKAKQIYLNTLAISAVNSYLNFLGWSTNLAESDSQNPILQAMMNVADLKIPGYGQVECCLVIAGQDSVFISPEVWSSVPRLALKDSLRVTKPGLFETPRRRSGSRYPLGQAQTKALAACNARIADDRIPRSKRIAYMVVEIDRSLSHSKVLGFVRQVTQTEIPLTNLESLAQFPAYLSQQRRQAFSINVLSRWFSGALEPGWQTVEELFPSTPSLNFRGDRKLTAEGGEPVTQVQADSGSSAVEGVRLVKLSGDMDYSIALILKIQPQNSNDFNVSVTICNEIVQNYLPEGLELVILDQVNHPVMIAQANQTETIEFCFSGETGESFSVEMSLDEHIHLEGFII